MQAWYADGSTAIRKDDYLQEWWDMMIQEGPSYGYFPNPIKTWLVTKKQFYQKTVTEFTDTGVNITSEGRPYLWAQ